MFSLRAISTSSIVISTLVSLVAGQAPLGGKASRYWDCCKPACSWPQGTSGTSFPVSAPVKVCSTSGSPITDPNAQSGCTGGPAYACTDMQPWAVSDQLAYGFAAVSVAGETDIDSCCGCYEITFTDGPAQGQNMIVQATNTGADLGTNQFDLLIPGGGPGLYNACPAQYGVSSSVFGQQWGGILQQSGCSGLPASLQAGCNFRFGWMKGADNPGVSFQKMATCPSALTDISGCVRNGETPSSGVQPPPAAGGQGGVPAAGSGSSSSMPLPAASSSSSNAPLPAAGSSSTSAAPAGIASLGSGSSLGSKPVGQPLQFQEIPGSSSTVAANVPPPSPPPVQPAAPPPAQPSPPPAGGSGGDGGLPFWAVGPSWGGWKVPNVPGVVADGPAQSTPTPPGTGEEGPDDECDEL